MEVCIVRGTDLCEYGSYKDCELRTGEASLLNNAQLREENTKGQLQNKCRPLLTEGLTKPTGHTETHPGTKAHYNLH